MVVVEKKKTDTPDRVLWGWLEKTATWWRCERIRSALELTFVFSNHSHSRKFQWFVRWIIFKQMRHAFLHWVQKTIDMSSKMFTRYLQSCRKITLQLIQRFLLQFHYLCKKDPSLLFKRYFSIQCKRSSCVTVEEKPIAIFTSYSKENNAYYYQNH